MDLKTIKFKDQILVENLSDIQDIWIIDTAMPRKIHWVSTMDISVFNDIIPSIVLLYKRLNGSYNIDIVYFQVNDFGSSNWTLWESDENLVNRVMWQITR